MTDWLNGFLAYCFIDIFAWCLKVCVCLGAVLSAADVEPTQSTPRHKTHRIHTHINGADQRPEIGHIEPLRRRKRERKMQEEADRRRKERPKKERRVNRGGVLSAESTLLSHTHSMSCCHSKAFRLLMCPP